MKFSLVCLLGFMCFIAVPCLRAEDLLMKVKFDDVTPKAPKPKGPAKGAPKSASETEKREIQITLTNTTKNDMKGLKVVAVYFSRSPGTPGINIEKSEELATDLAPGATAELKAQALELKFTPASRDPKGKRISANGSKFAGFGVQVLKEEKVIASKFEPRSLEQVLNKQ